jgi:hypothetical protein
MAHPWDNSAVVWHIACVQGSGSGLNQPEKEPDGRSVDDPSLRSGDRRLVGIFLENRLFLSGFKNHADFPRFPVESLSNICTKSVQGLANGLL